MKRGLAGCIAPIVEKGEEKDVFLGHSNGYQLYLLRGPMFDYRR
jgi:hypothetical protein